MPNYFVSALAEQGDSDATFRIVTKIIGRETPIKSQVAIPEITKELEEVAGSPVTILCISRLDHPEDS